MNQATLTLAMANQRVPAVDPVADARRLLHEAARLPYTTAQSSLWAGEFRQRVVAARRALLRHITRPPDEESPTSDVEREQPHLRTAVQRQQNDHAALALQLDRLCDDMTGGGPVDIWRMVDLGERAMRLEHALARHHDRLVRLVYESANREIGGRG